MPGKVNPVLCEAVIQVAAQVTGNDAAVALGGMTGHLELNAMIPLIARNLLASIQLLANVSNAFVDGCLSGIEVDRERAAGWVEQSLALATALVPAIGYDRATEIAKEAAATGRTVREVALARAVLPVEQLDRLLDARAQTEPGA
jgi:fumarate hydratase class II